MSDKFLSEEKIQACLAFDSKHVWHPYSKLPQNNANFLMHSAHGVRLTLADGAEVIDGMSSWWAAQHGYNHPKLNQAIIEQSQKMSHVMFGGLTHEPAIELAQKLVQMTAEPLQTVFFTDSGSVAVEVAMKMALQYWHAKNNKKRKKFLTIKSGYHGDTFATMSVCDPDNGMHQFFAGNVAEQFFAEAPACRIQEQWQDQEQNEKDIASFKKIILENYHDIAAVMLEPIVQGAGGMRFYSPEFLKNVQQLCDETDTLLIFDEIATGFGRTGKLFAYEWADVLPDILCLGKALTGGMMTLAATLTTEKIRQVINDEGGNALMHGPTFMANPLACAVANANMDLLAENKWQQQVANIEAGLKKYLSAAEDFSHVKQVRVLGAIGVIELTHNVDANELASEFIRRGVWVRPYLNLVYLMPPFVISNNELQELCEAVLDVVISLPSDE